MTKLLALTFLGPAVMAICFNLVVCKKIGLPNLVGGERLCFYRVLFAIPMNLVLMIIFLNASAPPLQFLRWFSLGLFIVGLVIALVRKSEFLFYQTEPNPIFKKAFLFFSKGVAFWLMLFGVGILFFSIK